MTAPTAMTAVTARTAGTVPDATSLWAQIDVDGSVNVATAGSHGPPCLRTARLYVNFGQDITQCGATGDAGVDPRLLPAPGAARPASQGLRSRR